MYRHFFAWIAVVQEEREPLPRCDLCGMHMPAGRLLKHQLTKRRERNTQKRWRRRDITIESLCKEATFSLTGEYNADHIEWVETFKCLGRILDQYDYDWPAVLKKFGKDRRVWNRLGKLLRQEGAEPRVSAIFYRAVVQSVLLFGEETWVWSEAMSRKIEGVHMGLLQRIMMQTEV